MKILFTEYPQIDPDEHIIDTNFYHWLNLNQEKDVFITALRDYLEGYGFSKKTCRITTAQLKLHKLVHNHFYWCLYHKV